MRVPLSWLSEFVDVPSDLDGFTSQCDMAGLEVEEILHLGAAWNGLVVGELASAPPIEGPPLHAVPLAVGGDTRASVCGQTDFIVKIPNASEHAVLQAGDSVKFGWSAEDCRALDVYQGA